MKKIFISSIIILSLVKTISGQIPCNKSVNSKDLTKKLPLEVCIPKGYTIFNAIDSVDLNKDNNKDVVVTYARLPLEDGDTIFYGLYLKNAKKSNYSLWKTLSNLSPIYLTSKSIGKNAKLDSIRKLLTYNPEIIIGTNSISIKFHTTTDYFGKSYIFKYDVRLNDFLLDKIQYWVGNVEYVLIEKYEWNDKYHEENLLDERVPDNKIKIEEFDLTKVMKIKDEDYWFYYNAKKKFSWF